MNSFDAIKRLQQLVGWIHTFVAVDAPVSKDTLRRIVSDVQQRAAAARQLVDDCDKTTQQEFDRLSDALKGVEMGIDTPP